MATQTFIGTLSVVECSSCGLAFGITADFHHRRQDDRKSFYCPNGHSQWFPGKTAAEERDEANQRAARHYQWYEEEVAAKRGVERRLSATQGVVTRTKKRIAAGTCPCCKRHFVGLERHMASQHPGYVEGVLP